MIQATGVAFFFWTTRICIFTLMRPFWICVFFCSLAVLQLQAQVHRCDWLFVYYMPYDNNMSDLRGPILKMIRSGIKSDRVIVTIQGDFLDSGMKRYLVLKDTILTFDVDGEGSAITETYRRYLDWVGSTVMAQNRAIVFLNHGGALDALGYDERPAPKFLRVDSLRTVLENFNRQTRQETDLLYLQVCAKGSIEPLYELRTTAHYTLASQHELGAPNYYYEQLFQTLSFKKQSAQDVARMMVDFDTREMYTSLTCFNNHAFSQTRKQFQEFYSSLGSSLNLLNTPLLITYYGQLYYDIVSFLNCLDLNDSQKETMRRLVEQIEKELIVFHVRGPGDERGAAYSGLSLVLNDESRASDLRHLGFYRDFNVPGLVAKLKSGRVGR